MSQIEDAAFKLPFRLEDQPAIWHMKKDESAIDLFGVLNLKEAQWPQGEMYGEVPAKPFGPGAWAFPQHKEFNSLQGSQLRGGGIQLLNGRIEMMGTESGTILATAAVLSKRQFRSDAPRLYNEIRVQIEDMDLLTTEKPLKEMTLPTELPLSIAASINENAQITWEVPENSLEYGYDVSLKRPDFNGINWVFAPTLTLKIATGISAIDWYQSWVLPLKELLSIAAGRPLNINYLLAHESTFKTGTSGDQIFGWDIKQTPLNAQREEPHRGSPAIKIISQDTDLLNLLITMKSLEEVGHPLVQTYSTLAASHQQHPRARVLLFLQSLEGAFGYHHANKTQESETKYQDDRKKIIGLLENLAKETPAEGQLSRKQLRFIKKNMVKKRHVSLSEVLESYFDNHSEIAWKELEDIEAVRSEFDDHKVGTTELNIAQALTRIRNALSHGRKSYTNNDLNRIAIILDRMVRCEFLELVGLDRGIAAKVFERP